MARKLILTRDDGAERVLEALEATKERALTIVAPRGSALADRAGLASIGERAAEKGVVVAIESVDEELLGLAHAAHLETVHPFFRADKRHLSLDGIVKNEAPQQHAHEVRVPAQHEEAPRRHEPARHVEETREEPEDRPVRVQQDEALPPHDHVVPTPVMARPSYEAEEPARPAQAAERPRKRFSRRKALVGAVLVLALVYGVGEALFRSGSVDVTLAETPWEYSATVVAATSVTTSTGTSLSIPGQLFQSDKNVAQQFPATGEPGAASAPAGAKPKVTVYNESLQAETFVVKTRFQGPSGIFRAATAVAIPAATKAGDKLTPGSASVEVVPDSASVLSGAKEGERLTVPGLAGSPKADLFYATLAKPAEPAAAPAQNTTPPSERVVTDADADNATKQINSVLASSFKATLLAQQPQGLTLIDGAITVEAKQLTVNKEVDAQGNFNLVGQATLRGLAFREDDLRALLLGKALAEKGIGYPAEFRDAEISYSEVQPDLSNGRLSFKVTVRGKVVGTADEDEIKAAVAGKSRGELADWFESQPQYSEGTASISPFWRLSLPGKPQDIAVSIK